jgi:hypothetical protein
VDILAELGRLTDARKQYAAALATTERLAKDQLADPRRQRMLATANHKLCDLLLFVRDRSNGEPYCHTAFAVAEILLAARRKTPKCEPP